MAASTAAFLAEARTRLARLSEALAAAAAPQDVAWTLCEFSGRELGLADCVVYLLDPGGATLTQQAAWGPKRAADRVLESRLTLAMDQGIVGRCARLRLPQRTPNARTDPRYVVDDQFNLSELAVPILADEILYGVLDSEHPDANYYDLDDEHVFLAIAERGALRLQRLLADTQGLAASRRGA
jgi:GAF domain-containing protein